MLGDQIVFMGILETLRVRHGLEKVDVAYVDDELNPFRAHGEYWNTRIEAKRAMFAMHELLPELGEIHHFVRDSEFVGFFNDTYDKYIHWPGFVKGRLWPSYDGIQLDFSAGSKTYSPDGTGLHHIKTPLNDFVELNGYLPRLRLPKGLSLEVKEKMRPEMVGFEKAVTCSVRHNEHDTARNTPKGAWVDFFREMRGSGIKFFVCSHDGEQEHFRDFEGDLVFTKDLNFEWQEDLAVMEFSRCVLFPNGGLMSWPWFAGIPSITFGRMPCPYNHFSRLEGMEHGGQLGFAGQLTKQCWGEYDSGTMIKEFNDLDEKIIKTGRANPWST